MNTISEIKLMEKESENKMIDIINCVRDSKNTILDEFQNLYNKK